MKQVKNTSRPIKKGVALSANRNVPLEYLNIDDKTGVFRSQVLHSFTSDEKKNPHSGHLNVAMKVKIEMKNGILVIVDIMDAECSCLVNEVKQCHHIAVMCYEILQRQQTPLTSAQLIPTPSTLSALDESWRTSKFKKHFTVDTQKPIARLPVQKNTVTVRGATPAKPKKRKLAMRAGTGGRFAGSYTCLPAGKVWQSRNKPICIEMANQFHRLYKEDSERGSTCVHETVWPATPADDGDYVEIPMDSIDYLRGEMKPSTAKKRRFLSKIEGLTEDDITELCNHEDPGQDDILDADPDA
jgi:hypothetical protein